MTTLHIDFETRSALDLKEVGLDNYVRHPSTDVWCMAYAVDDEEPGLWTPSEGLAGPKVPLGTRPTQFLAHNAPFELAVWNNIMAPRYGWPLLRPEQVHCTMAQSYAMGLPGALEDAALALGLSVLKDAEGRALMLRMARPRRMDGDKPVWWDEPEKLQRLYEYCRQDVRVERELHKRLMPLSENERRVWLMDYQINQRGIRVDVETAKAADRMAGVIKDKCDDAIGRVTGGAVQTANAVAALKDWCKAQGVVVESVAKQELADLLAGGKLPPAVEKALRLRQESAKASTAKLGAMLSRVSADGRLRGTTQYHGAATGRWAGRGVQVHNFPRDIPPAATVEKLLALVRAGNVDAIDLLYGPPMTMISKCLRSFFTASPDTALIAGDFANVEGRGIAWLAGEEWKLRAFREADAGTGPGIYELAYAKSFGVPVESVKDPSPERQIGKVMELAFGYGGGAGAFEVMGRNYGVKVAPIKADEFKHAWRAAHPRIKNYWYALQRAAVSAVQVPGQVFEAGHPGRVVKYRMAGSFLWCLLPSGRALCYPYPRLLEGQYGPELTYMKVPSPDAADKGKIVDDPKNASNWARVRTWGGSLAENVTQAVCRDILVDTMLPMANKVVLHVHDEIVVEGEKNKAAATRDAMEAMMRAAPAWAAGFPLYAKCKIIARYGK